MAKKIKSIAECGMKPTCYFEVGQLYPFPKGKTVTDIIEVIDMTDNMMVNERRYEIYNDDGLIAEMINCPVVLVYDQSEEE